MKKILTVLFTSLLMTGLYGQDYAKDSDVQIKKTEIKKTESKHKDLIKKIDIFTKKLVKFIYRAEKRTLKSGEFTARVKFALKDYSKEYSELIEAIDKTGFFKKFKDPVAKKKLYLSGVDSIIKGEFRIIEHYTSNFISWATPVIILKRKSSFLEK